MLRVELIGYKALCKSDIRHYLLITLLLMYQSQVMEEKKVTDNRVAISVESQYGKLLFSWNRSSVCKVAWYKLHSGIFLFFYITFKTLCSCLHSYNLNHLLVLCSSAVKYWSSTAWWNKHMGYCAGNWSFRYNYERQCSRWQWWLLYYEMGS